MAKVQYLVGVLLLIGCFVPLTHGADAENVIHRKLKQTQPPTCGGLGDYCDPVNWCCDPLYCDLKPWSGTCKQGTCSGLGHICGYVAADIYISCCWGLKCNDQHSCVSGGTTVSAPKNNRIQMFLPD